jgi:hypothetical protein
MNLLVDWLAFFRNSPETQTQQRFMQTHEKTLEKDNAEVLPLFCLSSPLNLMKASRGSYSNHITAARSMSRDKKKGEIMQQYIHVVHHSTAETAANSVAREVEFNFAEKKIIEILHVQLITQFLFLSGSFATTSCMYDCRVSPSESFVLCFGVY